MLHSILSAIMTMYGSSGAPWDYERWKEITGVTHGLFPDDNKQLPRGWSRKDAESVAVFFELFEKKGSEEEHIRFTNAKKDANKVPGRAFFQSWFKTLYRTSQIHAKITDTLLANSLHPVTIGLNSGKRSLDAWWPSSRSYAPRALEVVGSELFGPEALDDLGLLEAKLRAPTQALITRTWGNIHSQVKRLLKKIEELEAEAMASFEGMH